MGEVDQPIDSVIAADLSLILHGLDLQARHIAEQVASRVDSAGFRLLSLFPDKFSTLVEHRVSTEYCKSGRCCVSRRAAWPSRPMA